jgi:hypothetical protein
MKPTVHILAIHLPAQKIVLARDPDESLKRIHIVSPFERWFGRPIDSSHDQLIYIGDHSRYSLDARSFSRDVERDVCQPVHFANPSKII